MSINFLENPIPQDLQSLSPRVKTVQTYIALPQSAVVHIHSQSRLFNTPCKFIAGRVTGFLPYEPLPQDFDPLEPVLRNKIVFKRRLYIEVSRLLEHHGFTKSSKKKRGITQGFTWLVYCFDKQAFEKGDQLPMLTW